MLLFFCIKRLLLTETVLASKASIKMHRNENAQGKGAINFSSFVKKDHRRDVSINASVNHT